MFFSIKSLQKFWWFAKKPYLCIRFRLKTRESNTKEEFFERLT